LTGTAVSALVLGLVYSLTATYILSSAATAMVFVVMALVLIFRPIKT
jgi:branched-subunit amino acid ABC-type transport system permease component